MKVRKSVFETNSSSSHSLVVDHDSELNKQPFNEELTKKGVLNVQGGDYHWGYEELHSAEEKINYLAQQYKTTDNEDDLKLLAEVVFEYSGITLEFDYHALENGSIDHQSVGIVPAGRKTKIKKELIDLIFGKKSYIIISNDNM
jgi:hypothetical protein